MLTCASSERYCEEVSSPSVEEFKCLLDASWVMMQGCKEFTHPMVFEYQDNK